MDTISNTTNPSSPEQQATGQQHPIFRACTLYSMNEMLYQDGLISLEKKQQVEQEIWRKYRV